MPVIPISPPECTTCAMGRTLSMSTDTSIPSRYSYHFYTSANLVVKYVIREYYFLSVLWETLMNSMNISMNAATPERILTSKSLP